MAVPPEHVVDAEEPVRFAGSAAAATATPVNAVEALVLVIVNVSVDVCAVVIVVGENAAVMDGAVAGNVVLIVKAVSVKYELHVLKFALQVDPAYNVIVFELEPENEFRVTSMNSCPAAPP